MNQPRIAFLDAATIGNLPHLKLLDDIAQYTEYPFTQPDEVIPRLQKAQVALVNKVNISEEVMRACTSLRLICVTATGTDNVDLPAAKKQGIEVKNVAGYATETVAQHTFALLLHLLHQLNYYDRFVKTGAYARSPVFTHHGRPFNELRGKQIGIIGLGNIGRAVARIATDGFGMSVAYHSPSGRNLDQPYPHVGLRELLRTSDVVSIHSCLNEHTHALIDYERLQEMPAHSILLNLGRGEIVKEADLARAIDEEVIAGAGIDVFAKEPLPIDHPYLQVKRSDRLLLTPHIGWAAKEAREALLDQVISNITSSRVFLESRRVVRRAS